MCVSIIERVVACSPLSPQASPSPCECVLHSPPHQTMIPSRRPWCLLRERAGDAGCQSFKAFVLISSGDMPWRFAQTPWRRQKIAAILLLSTLSVYAVEGFVTSSISEGVRRAFQAKTGCWRPTRRCGLAGTRMAVPSVEVEYDGVKTRCDMLQRQECRRPVFHSVISGIPSSFAHRQHVTNSCKAREGGKREELM